MSKDSTKYEVQPDPLFEKVFENKKTQMQLIKYQHFKNQNRQILILVG